MGGDEGGGRVASLEAGEDPVLAVGELLDLLEEDLVADVGEVVGVMDETLDGFGEGGPVLLAVHRYRRHHVDRLVSCLSQHRSLQHLLGLHAVHWLVEHVARRLDRLGKDVCQRELRHPSCLSFFVLLFLLFIQHFFFFFFAFRVCETSQFDRRRVEEREQQQRLRRFVEKERGC